jgi:pilus assembly protein CpaE
VLDNADRIVLLATPDIPSLANTKLFFEVTEALEYSQHKILLVLNKMDRTGRITAKDIADSLKHQVVGQIMLDDKSVMQSINRGMPLALADRKSPVVQSIFDVAHYVVESLEIVEEEVKEEKRSADVRAGRGMGRLLG